VRLLRDPVLAQQLRSDEGLHEIFIEEVLRLDAPIHGLCRTAAKDVDLLGEHIKEGTKIQLLYAAANVDPGQFDDPHAFRLDRSIKDIRGKSLSFGYGRHSCIGAPLARLEAMVALKRMLATFEYGRLEGVPQMFNNAIFRFFHSVPMVW
jgi:cytochrome P450